METMLQPDEQRPDKVFHSIEAKIVDARETLPVAKTLELTADQALLDAPKALDPGEELRLAFCIGSTCLSPARCKVRSSHPVFGGKRHLISVVFEEPNTELIRLVRQDIQRIETAIGELLAS